jgi:hypothetical protein
MTDARSTGTAGSYSRGAFGLFSCTGYPDSRSKTFIQHTESNPGKFSRGVTAGFGFAETTVSYDSPIRLFIQHTRIAAP